MKTHSSAFDGLLSLIPAKYYYDDATQDQWQQKKKSKQELKQNKRAKLDPDSKESADSYTNAHVSAKDVMDNKAKTAPKVALPKKLPAPITEDSEDDDDQEINIDQDEDNEENEDSEQVDDTLMSEKSQIVFDDDGNDADDSTTFVKQDAQQQKRKKALSPEEQKKREENLAKLREKLSSKISTMKEKRRAPGTKVAGAPKSREQILEERKKKAELRKRKREEMDNEVSDDDNSDSDVEGDDGEDDNETGIQDGDSSVLFGNIVFSDGTRVTSDLGKIRSTVEKKSKKGPANNDIKAHLKILENKKRRLEQMSPEEQIKQKEKDKWTKVMAQAEGAKIKDDEKLLKKALKRKEKQKLKSEIEWKDRKQMVKDTKAARQKRRDENLKARRENKGKKSKNQPRLKKFVGTVHKKRAGFEGSSKSKGRLK